jgi:hypothetical protein
MSLTAVNDVPWPKLWHAYGPAVDIPETLHVLLTGDANARNEAGQRLAKPVGVGGIPLNRLALGQDIPEPLTLKA